MDETRCSALLCYTCGSTEASGNNIKKSVLIETGQLYIDWPKFKLWKVDKAKVYKFSHFLETEVSFALNVIV